MTIIKTASRLTTQLLDQFKAPHYVTLTIHTEKAARDSHMLVYAKHLSHNIAASLSPSEQSSLARQLKQFHLETFAKNTFLAKDEPVIGRTARLIDNSIVDRSLLAKDPIEIDLSQSRIYKNIEINPPRDLETLQLNVGRRWDRRKISNAAAVSLWTLGGGAAMIGMLTSRRARRIRRLPRMYGK
jgi:hypothetical protein